VNAVVEAAMDDFAATRGCGRFAPPARSSLQTGIPRCDQIDLGLMKGGDRDVDRAGGAPVDIRAQRIVTRRDQYRARRSNNPHRIDRFVLDV